MGPVDGVGLVLVLAVHETDDLGLGSLRGHHAAANGHVLARAPGAYRQGEGGIRCWVRPGGLVDVCVNLEALLLYELRSKR